MCVGGGGEAISKLKGAGQRVPSHAHTCMCPACSLDNLTKANPDGIFLILKCEFSEKFIRS